MLQTVLFNEGVLFSSDAFFDFDASIMVPVLGRTASDGLQQGSHDAKLANAASVPRKTESAREGVGGVGDDMGNS